MSSLTIYQDHYSDSTIIANLFIDEYMIEANDAQLKVYLYLVRLLSAHLSTSVSDIADKFNHTEKDVIRALKYWEKKNLLTIDYDEQKNLCGIHMTNPQSTGNSALAPSTKPVAEIVPIASVTSSGTSVPCSTSNAKTIVATPESTELMERPTYTLDQIKAFKSNEETEQLLFIVEQYVGRPLSPSDIKTILFISDHLSFHVDLIDYLIQYCVDRGKKDFRYIEKVALCWAEENIKTVKQAASYIEKYDKNTYQIMKSLGKSASPTSRELDFIKKWTNEFGFTLDIIMEACDRTVLSTDKHRFEYADGILGNWKKQNVLHSNDIKSLDENFKKNRESNTAATQAASTNNKFNQFKQNAYDFSELEKEILSN